MKKLAIILSQFCMQILIFTNKVFAAGTYTTDFPYSEQGRPDFTAPGSGNPKDLLRNENQEGSILERFLDLFNINYAGPEKALVYIQVVINYLLALVALIAMSLIIYSFYMIFFGKSEDGIAKARKTIIGSAIAIIVLGIAAYVVNFLFFIYNTGA